MNMISLLQLNNLLKHHLILEYYERGIEAMCVKEFLPLCAALLYPYKNEYFPPENKLQGNITPIIESVKSFTKKTKGLENYSLDGLRKYFQSRWLPTLDFNTQIRLIKGVSLIDKVEDDGFFSLNGNDKVYQAYLKIPVLDISHKYGELPFETPNEEELVMECNSTTPNPENDEEAISLEPLKSFLWTSKLSGLNTNSRFFWEYKLNKNQYDSLKDILIKMNLGKNTCLLRKEIVGYGTVARVVALFVSEWYKRECDDLRGFRGLESIGLTGKSEQVWTNAALPNTFLHQEGDRNQMRQIAMCALGGLPLKIVNSSNRFKNLINGLFDIYQKGEAADEDIENVVNSFDGKNGVFKKSLISGSCKEYLVQLVKYLESGNDSDLPFNESDVKESPFSEFISQLKEGYDQELPKRFFTPEIRIWTYDYFEDGDDSSQIESEFYIHIGLRKSKNVITKRELSKLGVFLPDGINTFNLRLKTTNNDATEIWSDEFRTYFKIGNNCDDFCGAYGSDITIPINLFDAKKISLLIVCGEYQKEIYQYSIPQYIELFSTDDFYLWTTRKNNAARKVLLYNTLVYRLQNIDDLVVYYKKNKNTDNDYTNDKGTSKEWGWIYQKDIIYLEDNNDEIIEVSLGASELITVDFRTKELGKNIKLISDGCVQAIIDGETCEPVSLLYYSQRKQFMLTCDGYKDNQLINNYKIEFKPINSHEYTDWTNTNCPTQGFIKLRITCKYSSKKKRPWTSIVYFIPECNPIVSRNLDNKLIYFNANDVCPLDKSLHEFSRKGNDSFKYRFQDGTECGLDSPTIAFRIGDDDNHIIVDTYRAFNWQQIWNNNVRIKDKIDGNKPPVAIILQKNIRIKAVNENGYQVYAPQYSNYINYFENPLKMSFSENDGKYDGIIIDSKEAYQQYVYLSRYEDKSQGETKIREIKKGNENIILYISNDFKDQYGFYYWSGQIEDNPIKLVSRKLEDRKYEYYIPFRLTDKAVVFQSLKEYLPNFYFRPFYADENIRWGFYIERYKNVGIDYLIKCYQLAVEHGVYFCVFPALKCLQNRDKFTDFIKTFIQRKNYHLSNKDRDNITRLAMELAMDWFFVDRKRLFRDLNVEDSSKMCECMKGLLLKSSIERGEHAYALKFIDRFLQDHHPFNQRNGNLARQFLKAIDKFADYDGCDNTENRIGLLNQLVNSPDNIFKEICRILNI